MNIKVLLESGEYHFKGICPGIHWIDHAHSALRYSDKEDLLIDAKRPNCTTLIVLPYFAELAPLGDADAYRCMAVHIREDLNTKQVWGFQQFLPRCLLSIHDTEGFKFSGLFDGVDTVQDQQGVFSIGEALCIQYIGRTANRKRFMNETEEIFRCIQDNVVAVMPNNGSSVLKIETSIIQY